MSSGIHDALSTQNSVDLTSDPISHNRSLRLGTSASMLLSGYLVRDHADTNSSMASSPASALVYRATMAPELHPAAVRTDASEMPDRRDSTAQPRRHAWADGS